MSGIERAQRFAAMRRALSYPFPAKAPEALVLIETPWARVQRAYVREDAFSSWHLWLVGEHGHVLHDPEIQRARLPTPARLASIDRVLH